jgi:hypothetical protein
MIWDVKSRHALTTAVLVRVTPGGHSNPACKIVFLLIFAILIISQSLTNKY